MVAAIEMLPGFAPLAERYRCFVLDLWGTLHDGFAPLPGAVECLTRLKATGKPVACLSNAPFRADEVKRILARVGIAAELYDVVYSSGEETWQALARRPDAWYRALGRRCLFVGAARHEGMLDNPGIERVEELADAEFLLCTGPWEDTASLDAFVPLLRAAAARDLPLVCANPDRVVLRGARRNICAGALAEYYERELAGTVRWHGKPHGAVYRRCLELIGVDRPAAALMVGDSLVTDIAGARAAGLGAAFITGGIYAKRLGIAAGELPSADALAALCAADGPVPDIALPAFVW